MKAILLLSLLLLCSCSVSQGQKAVDFDRCVIAIRAGMNAACVVGCLEGHGDEAPRGWKRCAEMCKAKVNKAFDEGLENSTKKW